MGGALMPNPFHQLNNRQESEHRLLLNTRVSRGDFSDSDDSSGSELEFGRGTSSRGNR